MKTHARVVIVGGGIMGVGLLYHLALEGWTDVVLIEKGELTSGSTWHAAGQCPHFNGSLSVTRVHVYGTQLYPRLAGLTGQAVSWHGCGGLRLATTDEEVDWLGHVHGIAQIAGYDAYVIGPAEIRTLHPFLELTAVKAALYTTQDGHVSPADVTHAMAAGARQRGAGILRRTRVCDIRRLSSGEWCVVTDQGEIICEHVVNSAGSYCAVVGAWTGLQVPVANLLHHYVVTEPVRELMDRHPELPVVRDPAGSCYLRQEGNGFLVGPYEQSAAHQCWHGQAPPWEFESELLPPELDRLTPWLVKAAERLPLFAQAGLKAVISGAITHTPDGVYLSGPAPGLRNYWMHCGASIGIAQGAGAGKFLAQWMVHGQAEINMREFDPRRFGPWADQGFTSAAALEDYQRMYHCLCPGEQPAVPRRLRTSSLFEELAREGAQYSQVFGWERPRWFNPSEGAERYSWRRSNWWEPVREECLAVRERVGLMDLSALAKFEVSGPDASRFLTRICANRLPAEGGIVLAHLLSAGGFIESELTIARLAAERFYVTSSAAAQIHDRDQLESRRQPGERVAILDVTDDFGVLVLAGPRARDVLGALTLTDLGNTSFPWLRCREAQVAGVGGVRLLRMNYVGELGWELHVPMSRLSAVYGGLKAAGAAHGMRSFGSYAMNSLRLEKAYRAWGSELTNEVTLIEAGLTRFIDFDKDFSGRAGMQHVSLEGQRTSLAYLEVDAVDADCLGSEPVYSAERLVGVTTSGAFGFAVRKSLAFAYVEPAIVQARASLRVWLRGKLREATLLHEPAWDAGNSRLRC